MLQQPPWTENGAWEIQAKQTLCKSPHLWVIHTEEFIGENDICWDLLWNNPAGAGGGGRELQKTQGQPCGEHLLKLGDGHLMAHYSIPCLHVWEFSYFHNENLIKASVMCKSTCSISLCPSLLINGKWSHKHHHEQVITT